MKLEIDIPYYMFEQIKRENTIKSFLHRIDFAVRNGVERPHGEWKTSYLDHVSFGVRPKVIYCSNCNSVVSHKANFCEECGSDNRKRGEAE